MKKDAGSSEDAAASVIKASALFGLAAICFGSAGRFLSCDSTLVLSAALATLIVGLFIHVLGFLVVADRFIDPWLIAVKPAFWRRTLIIGTSLLVFAVSTGVSFTITGTMALAGSDAACPIVLR